MFSVEVKKIENTKYTNNGSFLQTPFWGEFKSEQGWKNARYFLSIIPQNKMKSDSLKKSAEVSVLTREFGKGLLRFTLAYIPLFPSLCFDDIPAEEQTIEFSNMLFDIAKALRSVLPKNTICIKFDPAVEFETPEERDEFDLGVKVVSFADRLKIKKNKVDIQPPDSTLINLLPEEEKILSSMKTKWRYNVNLSARKGVEIIKITGENKELLKYLDIFYDLYKITADRDGIAIHSKKYYETLLKKSAEEIKSGKDVPLISLYIAKHGSDYLGAIITLFSKTESVYLYGCSSNVKRNLMPNFLLQWTAMKDAKAYGSKYYDMYGMPPTDNPNHPMHGLYLFKTGFGGKNIHRPGTFDVPTSLWYKPYSSAEKIRAFWHKKILKKIRGR